MRSERYLNEIREAEGLKRAVLQKIVVDGKTAEFFLLTDLTYSAEDVAHADRRKPVLPNPCRARRGCAVRWRRR